MITKAQERRYLAQKNRANEIHRLAREGGLKSPNGGVRTHRSRRLRHEHQDI